tara:strand:- start:1078 stop:1608 length:531 start_codon:yes stop_codon:yes gene_type:complete
MAKIDLKDTKAEFKKFGDRVIHRARFYLERRNINTSTSALSKSLNYELKVYDSGALGMRFEALDYFPFVEEGRKSGKQPPVSAIAKWIKIKPIRIRGAKGRFVSKTEANINSAAFGIAKSIGDYGIKPTFFFRDAFAMHYKRLKPEIIEAYANDSAKFLKRLLMDNKLQLNQMLKK